MNLQSWQISLLLGAALSLALDWGGRALILWWRRRGRVTCSHCDGFLGNDRRAEFLVERLEACHWCGDTWAKGMRPKYVGIPRRPRETDEARRRALNHVDEVLAAGPASTSLETVLMGDVVWLINRLDTLHGFEDMDERFKEDLHEKVLESLE